MDTTKLSDFITPQKIGTLVTLDNILTNHIINKIKAIPIFISDIEDRIKWKFTSNGQFSLKSITWANNNNNVPLPRAYCLNNICN